MVKPFKNKNPTYIGLLGWDLEERRDLSHPWMELFLWKRKNSFLDMNPGKAIWIAEWRMNRTGLGDPFGPKILYRSGSYEHKGPLGKTGSK